MRHFAKLLIALLLLPQVSVAQQTADQFEPEIAGAGTVATTPQSRAAEAAKLAGQPVEAQEWMISAAHPLAVEAGSNILRQGGTAAECDFLERPGADQRTGLPGTRTRGAARDRGSLPQETGLHDRGLPST